MKNRLRYAALLLLPILLSACGGGGSDPSPAGTLSRSYRLVVSGNSGTADVKGIQFVLLIPPGAVLRLDGTTSAILPESLSLSGQAPADAFLAARYATGSAGVAVVTLSGLGAGEFATLTCDLAAGSAAPAAADFIVKDPVAVGSDGNHLPGISVTVR